jgi:hypothetical protein
MPELIDRDEVLKALEEIAVTFDYLVWGDVEHVVKAATPRRCETCEWTADGHGHYCLLMGINTRDDFGCTRWEAP